MNPLLVEQLGAVRMGQAQARAQHSRMVKEAKAARRSAQQTTGHGRFVLGGALRLGRAARRFRTTEADCSTC